VKRYFLRRLALLLPTLLGTLTLVFFLIHMIPGDPVDVMLGETAGRADKEELRRSLGLDQPVHVRYRTFLAGLAVGDLGRSIYEQAEVADLIRARLPATIKLALAALCLPRHGAAPGATAARCFFPSWDYRFLISGLVLC
jgi:peptide/nickel transport system permease protein